MASRDELRKQGEALRERLFGPGAAPGDAAHGYRELMAEAVYGSIWSRPGLALADRMLCTLASLCAVRAHASLSRHIAAAAGLGISQESICEVFIQVGIYAGFSASEDAIGMLALAPGEKTEASPEPLMQRGDELLRKLHGLRGKFGYAAPDNVFTSTLYPLAIEYGYGEIWHRPGLDLRQRVMLAIAAFAALRMEDQLKKFAQSAPNAGLSREEVREAVVQIAPASGFAAALNALRWLSEVL